MIRFVDMFRAVVMVTTWFSYFFKITFEKCQIKNLTYFLSLPSDARTDQTLLCLPATHLSVLISPLKLNLTRFQNFLFFTSH